MGIYTGLHIQAEALTLKWEDIEFKRGLLTVRAAYAKSGESGAVNLNSIVKAALKQLREIARRICLLQASVVSLN